MAAISHSEVFTAASTVEGSTTLRGWGRGWVGVQAKTGTRIKNKTKEKNLYFIRTASWLDGKHQKMRVLSLTARDSGMGGPVSHGSRKKRLKAVCVKTDQSLMPSMNYAPSMNYDRRASFH
jgi:hypothetical protein